VQFPASRRKTLFGETPNTTRGDAYAPRPLDTATLDSTIAEKLTISARAQQDTHPQSHCQLRSLKERSPAANLRQELGHSESDLAVDKQSKAAFVVSVERKTVFCE
jgi:IS30 family transposase